MKALLVTVAIGFLSVVNVAAQWLPANQTSGPIYYNGGNVGIGTSAPNVPFHILQNVADASGIMLENQNAVGSTKFVTLSQQGSGGWGTTSWANAGLLESQSSGGLVISAMAGNLTFQTALGRTTAMTIRNANQFVGIGTTNPTARLDVNGDINVSGNINAKYQDVAEWVPASEEMAPGTVVDIDRTTSNTVGRSQHAYDTNVAGVVSSRPGLTLGERGASKVLVATTGRVLVRVTAANGAIEVGDLLVASDRPGLAMKSVPVTLGGIAIHRPGTIMGKALEPLPSGEGQVLVLLTLQ
jgi:hypothetical protein